MRRKIEKIFEIIKISSSKRRVLRSIRSRLRKFDEKGVKFKKIVIATPNPEILLLVESDILLYSILASTDILLMDGIGLAQAVKFMQLKAPKNPLFRAPIVFIQGLMVGLATFVNKKWLLGGSDIIHGSDFMLDLIGVANKKKWKVVFLGGVGDVAEKSAVALRANYKGVKMFGLTGPVLNQEGIPTSKEEKRKEAEILKEISRIRPQILFVGFGAPKQEKWIYRVLTELDVGVVMAVGGAFDYLAGKVPRPPKIVKKLELEWLWRLFTRRRVRRVFNAVVVFPFHIFLLKLCND